MAKSKANNGEWRYALSELRYYVVLCGLVLMAPLSLVALLWMLPAAQAADNWDVEGVNGVLHIRGALTESACRLEMDSARQDIRLGEVATGWLKQIGRVVRRWRLSCACVIACAARPPAGMSVRER